MAEEIDYERVRAEYESSSDDMLTAWAAPYFCGEKKADSRDVYLIGEVSDRAAADIKALTGSDVSGFQHALRADIVWHVQKRHGDKGAADQSMQDLNDLGRIGYILQNYDEIIAESKPTFGMRNKSNGFAAVVTFVKRIDGYVYSAEAVTDSSKKKTLYMLSMYKAKSAKKESRELFENPPEQNVRNATDSSTGILPHPSEKVNISAENNRANFKAFCADHKDELEKSGVAATRVLPKDGGHGK